MPTSLVDSLRGFFNSIDPSGTLATLLGPIAEVVRILLWPFYALGLIFGPIIGLPY